MSNYQVEGQVQSGNTASKQYNLSRKQISSIIEKGFTLTATDAEGDFEKFAARIKKNIELIRELRKKIS